jgi:hypothetical protein
MSVALKRKPSPLVFMILPILLESEGAILPREDIDAAIPGIIVDGTDYSVGHVSSMYGDWTGFRAKPGMTGQ